MYYLIKETLMKCSAKDMFADGAPYVAVITPEEWKKNRELFAMGIDIDEEPAEAAMTRVMVNYDSLTGSINIPELGYEDHEAGCFNFALDEKGIVFIDREGLAGRIIEAVGDSRRWKMPSLERFIYDFLEKIIEKDQSRLEQIELQLERMEDGILNEEAETAMPELNDIRGDLLDMNLHYSQLLDLGQELEENENDFFADENLRFFHMFNLRVERLREMVQNLREYSVQLRDLIQTRIDVKQNRIMTLLTVITTVFTPLTLLTGWYGMNFRYMPELNEKWGYPGVMLLSAIIAAGCLIYFKKKKWL